MNRRGRTSLLTGYRQEACWGVDSWAALLIYAVRVTLFSMVLKYWVRLAWKSAVGEP